MPIKNLSEVRRLPRLGKIRLGIKKTKDGKEYPAEVDHFILDPQTPSDEENKQLIEDFQKLYGPQPKAINIMLPLSDIGVVFPQFYKRYGKSTLLQCKGNGEEATCSSDEFAKGLEVLRKTDFGLPVVKCQGANCSYYKDRQCTECATLQVLLPELPGSGIWQITTGSFNSIVNINSCLDYIKAVAGRFHMIPLKLERREQLIQYEGKKSRHYTLYINMDIKLMNLQKITQIEPTKILLELPEPDKDDKDVMIPVIQEDEDNEKFKEDPIGKGDEYGSTMRFGKGRDSAENLIKKIKECREKMGEEKFGAIMGSLGYESVAEINEISVLSKLANTLLEKSKELI